MALFYFLLAFPIFLFFLLHKPRLKKHMNLPPGPRGLPFIGNLHQLDNSAPHRHLWLLSRKYGPLMSLRLGFVPQVVVSSAKMAEKIMKTHDLDFCSRPALRGQQVLSYNGFDVAFSPYNAYWREIRKICVVHLFNSIRVQRFRGVREDEVSRMIEKISKSADDRRPIDLSETMKSLSNSIVCRVGFGKRFDDESVERKRFYELIKETEAMFIAFFFSDHFPLMGWVDKLTGLLSRLDKNFREFDAFYQELIDEHLDPKRPTSEHEDIIDVLLQIMRSREFKVDLTYDHVKAVLMNIFVAGTNTAAAAVVWAMTFLMKNPEIMKRAQDEVRTVVGDKGHADEDDVFRLTYLKAVIKESMRMQPPVPILVHREAIRDCDIDGFDIPAKTVVLVNVYAIGRDPQVWENPERFCPDRFIANSSIDWKGLNFELIPFGSGRRICPGMFMGMAAVELSLANLVYKYDWEMPSGMAREDLDFDVLPGLAMHKKHHLCLMASKFI